jgi:hypothetical protein
MQKTTQNDTQIHWEDTKPIEFERILALYGMKKQDYCNLRSKSKSWWHNSLIKKQHLSYSDVKILADEIGAETFNMLLQKVREQHSRSGNEGG